MATGRARLRPSRNIWVHTEVRPPIPVPYVTRIWAYRWIRVCRDAKDNKFLALAAACRAEFLITGDDDLLILNPFRETHILTPAQFTASTGHG